MSLLVFQYQSFRVHLLTAICICILWVVNATGTTILAVRTPDVIVILSDSKPTFRGIVGPPKVCKIFPINSGVVAISGLDHDSGRGFYSKDLVGEAFRSAGNFSSHVSKAEKLVIAGAEAEIKRLKTEDPETFAFTIKKEGNFLDLLFVTVQNMQPLLAARRFHYDFNNGSVVVSQAMDCPGKDCPNGTYVVYVGETDAVQEGLKKNRSKRVDLNALRNLMLKQIAATPDKVGLPITILQLNPNESHWVNNEVGCPLLNSKP